MNAIAIVMLDFGIVIDTTMEIINLLLGPLPYYFIFGYVAVFKFIYSFYFGLLSASALLQVAIIMDIGFVIIYTIFTNIYMFSAAGCWTEMTGN